MRIFREPCYFAEAVYLLYYFVNEISYEEDFNRVCKNYCRKGDEEEEEMLRRIREMTRVSRVVTPSFATTFKSCLGLTGEPRAAWLR